MTTTPGTDAHTQRIREDIHHNGREALERIEEAIRGARHDGRMTSPMTAQMIDDRLAEIAESIGIGAVAIVRDRVPDAGKPAEDARERLDEDSDQALDSARNAADAIDWIGLAPEQAVEQFRNIARQFAEEWAERTQNSAYAASQGPDDSRNVRQEILQEAEAMIRGLTDDQDETLQEYGL